MSDLVVGDVLASKYEIKAVLGAGGMGTVYRARQLDLGRDVAIKIPRPEALEVPGFLARFTREALTVARLTHDNIVQVYEYSEADKNVYIVMEFVEGQDLKALVGKPPDDLTIRDLANILRASCEGLSHAHEFGIVHRDIKPHNIMVQRGSRNKWRVKIMDFGIAHLEANANFTVQQEQLTMTGQAIGTPSYMAPEQIRGSGVSAKSDIYSMGCVIFFCFARTTPFQGSGFTVAAAHLSEPPPSIRARLPVLPPAVDAIIHRCLAKDPDQRPSDASDLGNELYDALQPLFDTPMAELWNTAVDGLGDTDMIPNTIGGATVTADAGATVADAAATVVGGDSSPATPKAPHQPTVPQVTNTGNRTAHVTGSTRAYDGPAGQPVPEGALPPAVSPLDSSAQNKKLVMILAGVMVPILVLGTAAGILLSRGKDAPGPTPNDQVVVANNGGGEVVRPDSPGGGTSSGDQPGPLVTPVPPPVADVVQPDPTATLVPRPTATAPPPPTPEPTATPDPVERQLALAQSDFQRADEFTRRVAVWESHGRREDPRFRQATDEWAKQIVQAPVMVAVPNNSFTMGHPSGGADATPHNVELRSYFIGRYEVTAFELSVYLNSMEKADAERAYGPITADHNVVFSEERGRFEPREGRALHPANGVSWNLASAYAQWLRLETGQPFRLPTEAEWEYAARSDQGHLFPWGNTTPAARQANFNSSAGTLPVDEMREGMTRGQMHHMAGNVAEWCEDFYDPDAYRGGARSNPLVRNAPSGAVPRRVIRGGSFISRTPDDISAVKRARDSAASSSIDYGFRLVRDTD